MPLTGQVSNNTIVELFNSSLYGVDTQLIICTPCVSSLLQIPIIAKRLSVSLTVSLLMPHGVLFVGSFFLLLPKLLGLTVLLTLTEHFDLAQ